jgi:hypothetical protein
VTLVVFERHNRTVPCACSLSCFLLVLLLYQGLGLGRGSGSTTVARRHDESQRNRRENSARASDLSPPSTTRFNQMPRASENSPSSFRPPPLSDGTDLVPGTDVSGRASTALIDRAPPLAPSQYGESFGSRPDEASTGASQGLGMSQQRPSNNAAAPRPSIRPQAQQHGPRASQGRAQAMPGRLRNGQGRRPAASASASRHSGRMPVMSEAERDLVIAHGRMSSRGSVDVFLASVRPPPSNEAAPGQPTLHAQQHGAHARQGRSAPRPGELGNEPGARPTESASDDPGLAAPPGDPGLAPPMSQREQEVTMSTAEQERVRLSLSRTGQSSSTRPVDVSTAAPAPLESSRHPSAIDAAAPRQSIHQARQGVSRASQGRSVPGPGVLGSVSGAGPTVSAPPDPGRGSTVFQREVENFLETARAGLQRSWQGWRWGPFAASLNASSVSSTGQRPDQLANSTSQAPVNAIRLRFLFARQPGSRLTSVPC